MLATIMQTLDTTIANVAVAVGALQMFLDRGEQNDWFSSTETWWRSWSW
jgi:hypothetical protein